MTLPRHLIHPDMLWLHDTKRRDAQESLALLVQRAAAITRKAERENRGPNQLAPAERERISELVERAYRLAALLRETL